jgi:3-hydroxybutyryl-CoA dehydrogenase
MPAAQVIGVVGAGTMGAGIAQLAARSGARTLLHDPLPEALGRGAQRARDGLAKEAAKGKLSPEQADAAAGRIEPVDALEALAECELVIEAAPERIELKHELYRRLAEIVSEECVLASNTSSLPITAIAAAVTRPERVVGMHFFNPAPIMRLLEVIAGVRSDERSLELADATGRAMGKDTIRAADGPGFLVNRCNRPFGLEALKLLAERIADVKTIDRIVRMGGGFKMGPFELSDLVGVDTGLDVAKSFYELSFGEPRWRPSPIQARQAAAGLHGRKTGRGYYDYGEEPYRPPDPDPPQGGSGEGVVAILGESPLAEELREAARKAGYDVRSGPETPGELPGLTVECDPPGHGLGGAHPAPALGPGHGAPGAARAGGGIMFWTACLPARPGPAVVPRPATGPPRPGSPATHVPAESLGAQRSETEPTRPPADAPRPDAHRPESPRPESLRPPPPEPLRSPRLMLCARGSLAALDIHGDAVGFHALSPFARTGLVELTRGPRSSPAAVARAERFFTTLGTHIAWVGDAPGLVLGRIACQLVNEAAFALGEGVGSARDIDTGMTLGLNHPRGPLEWADEIGLDVVLGVLEALCEEYREERYRPAPELRRLVRAGRLGRVVGAGFFDYDVTA